MQIFQPIVRQLSGSRQAVVSQLSGSHRAVVRQLSGSLETVVIRTDRKNVTNFSYLVLYLAGKVTCYFWLISLVLVSVLRTSIDVLSKSKSKNYVTWIANLTKLFLSVVPHDLTYIVKSKPWGRFHKFLWPSQKSWTLQTSCKNLDKIENHTLISALLLFFYVWMKLNYPKQKFAIYSKF